MSDTSPPQPPPSEGEPHVENSPAEEPAPANEQPSLSEEPAPAEQPGPADDPAPIQETSPAEEATHAQEAALEEKNVPAEVTGEIVEGRDAVEEKHPIDDAAPHQESAPGDAGATTEDMEAVAKGEDQIEKDGAVVAGVAGVGAVGEAAAGSSPSALLERDTSFKAPLKTDARAKLHFCILMCFTIFGLIFFVAMYIPFIVLVTQPANYGPDSWQYDFFGLSPPFWYNLSKDYATCGTGVLQSPIDITRRDAVQGDFPRRLGEIIGGPQSSKFSQTFDKNPVMTCTDNCGILTWDSVEYVLHDIVFHGPSEHAVDSVRLEMEAQITYVNQDTSDKAIIVVFFQATSFRNNSLLNAIWWSNMNATGGQTETVEYFQVNELFSPLSGFFNYYGSVTTPPCSENAQYFVQKNLMSVSQDQLSYLWSADGLIGFPGNARDLQAVGNRVITEY